MDADGIVVFSSVPWDYLKIAPQQTCKNLAKHTKVLFLDRATSFAGLIFDTDLASEAWERSKRPPEEIAPGLFRMTPGLAPPYRGKAVLPNRWVAQSLGKTAKRGMEELGIERPIVISYIPQTAPLAGKLNEALWVYDVIDEYGAFPGIREDVAQTLEAEQLSVADLVVAISPNLVADRVERAKDVRLLPIGAETDHFLEADLSGPAPEAFEARPRPWVGYYGGLDDRFDAQMLEAAAKKLPEASFLMFGPVRDPSLFDAVRPLPNVSFPGPIDYAELPNYAGRFDLAVLPYRQTRFNKYIFPNKIFEYLATGAPVVASPIPSISYLAEEGLIEIASTPDEFAKKVAEGIARDRQGAEARIEHARRNTWENRAEILWGWIQEVLATKEAP